MRLAFSSAAAVAAALVVAGAAGAHVDVSPTFVPAGGTTVLSLTAHNDRDEPMTGFAVTVPDGLRITRGVPVDDWGAQVAGATATWTGGSLIAEEDATFDVEVESTTEPGPVELVVEQFYPGAIVVRWRVRITVVPVQLIPTEETEATIPWWAIAVLVVLAVSGLAMLALTLLAMRRRRARTLQER